MYVTVVTHNQHSTTFLLTDRKRAFAYDTFWPLLDAVQRWSSHVIEGCDRGVPGTNKTNANPSADSAIGACHSLGRG